MAQSGPNMTQNAPIMTCTEKGGSANFFAFTMYAPTLAVLFAPVPVHEEVGLLASLACQAAVEGGPGAGHSCIIAHFFELLFQVVNCGRVEELDISHARLKDVARYYF